jgi:hypothetical protein
MKTMLLKIARIPITLTILLAFLMPTQSVYADDDLPHGKCECVTYVVFSLFNKRLDGSWLYAKSMANPDFWSAKHMTGNGLSAKFARSRSNTAKSGDVIIFQSDATYYVQMKVWNSQFNRYDLKYVKQTSAGYGAGHIGIVLSAKYSGQDSGWYITMESANWPESWGQYISASEGSPQFYDSSTGKYFECKNVSYKQYIFVPNGDKISFWTLNK